MSFTGRFRLDWHRPILILGLGLCLALGIGTVGSHAQGATRSAAAPLAAYQGNYDHREEHLQGQYHLQRRGQWVTAHFTSVRTMVNDRDVLFTLPMGFRPGQRVIVEAEGWPLQAEGHKDTAVMVPQRFYLHIDPNGEVHYGQGAPGERADPLAYALAMQWYTPEVSGTYLNLNVHHQGQYALHRSGSTVTGLIATTHTPVPHWQHLARVFPRWESAVAAGSVGWARAWLGQARLGPLSAAL